MIPLGIVNGTQYFFHKGEIVFMVDGYQHLANCQELAAWLFGRVQGLESGLSQLMFECNSSLVLHEDVVAGYKAVVSAYEKRVNELEARLEEIHQLCQQPMLNGVIFVAIEKLAKGEGDGR